MMDRLGIGRKLALMLALPLGALLLLSALQTSDRLATVRSMTRLDALTAIAVAAGQLAHQMQRERGQSARFLSGDDLDAGEMEAERVRTDAAAAAFRQAVGGRQLDVEVEQTIESCLQAIDSLPSHRSLISNRSGDAEVTRRHYTTAIASLLELISSVTERADSSSIALQLVSLDALVRLKEVAGQERAALAVLFRSGRGTRDTARGISERIGMEEAHEETFLSHASSDAVERYRSIASSSTDLHRMRDASLEIALQSELVPEEARTAVAADDWWRASSARIDALFEVEHLIEAQVRSEMDQVRDSAVTSLTLSSLLAMGSLAAALLLSLFLARNLIRSFTAASETLQSVVAQITAFVKQQAASTTETAASVTQTTTTVEEIRKTSEAADARSKEMSRVAQASKVAADDALTAVDHGTSAMKQIRSDVETIAHNILDLSEKNIRIGEIVQSVNAIAEQSNLLAVNASIEAAKAGEHGRGFSVVAAEVKALAQQSKDATEQIRGILGEIQKSSNRAVMITEQGVKRVEEGGQLIEELGRAIRSLGVAIDGSSDASTQISLITGQQLIGIEQITEAMRNVGIAAGQNADGARQLEEASSEIRAIASRILDIVRGRDAARVDEAGPPDPRLRAA